MMNGRSAHLRMGEGAKNDPIGWDGKTLIEMYDEAKAQLKVTGHCYGLERMELKDTDPILYEKLFARIRGAAVDSREIAKRIAASPIVEESGELCFALYTPEGDSVAMSLGIIAHIHTMSGSIQYMVKKNYESNPGIRPGDIFANNDPQISDVHCADVQTIVPIFWEDELIGWAAAVTHEYDIGAKTPGANAVGPTNRLEDGICLSAIKCGENDTLYTYYQEYCKKAVRTPLFWELDEKTRLTGCHLIRKLVYELIKDEGIETYKQFIREVVEEGRRSFIGRVKELLVPGTYRSPSFIDYQFAEERALPIIAAKDGILHAPMQVTVHSDGRWETSFQGANEWGWHSFNCTPIGIYGAFWVVFSQTLMVNDKVNDGAQYATNLDAPPGSWVDPQYPMTAHANAWYILVPAAIALTRTISRGFQARGFIEEVIAGWGDGNYMQGGSDDPVDYKSVVSQMEPACVGAGAGIIQDGLDHASTSWFPTADMGEIEGWELVEPLLYLGRSVKKNSCGFGRQRGGLGFDSLRMVWSDNYNLQVIGEGAMFCHSGLFGGYPGGAGYRHNIHDTDLKKRFENQEPYPVLDGDPDNSEMTRLCDGREVLDNKCCNLPEPFKRYDLYNSFIRGGPGLGDPLLRTINDVQSDLDRDTISRRIAEKVYGAVVNEVDKRFVIDEEATINRRDAILNEREKRAVPVSEWIVTERENKILKKDVIQPVADMYRSSMELSEKWAKEYRDFWDLPEEFIF